MKKVFIAVLILLAASLPLGCAAAPGDAAVTEAYESAAEAYAWFDLTTMPVSDTDRVEADGQVYNRVEHDSIETLAQLRSYLGTLFSREIIDRLLPGDESVPRYRDIDGRLYAIPADRGTDITKGGERLDILRENGRVICRVTVETVDSETFSVTGEETYDFPYENTGGEWVFTEFSLVR